MRLKIKSIIFNKVLLILCIYLNNTATAQFFIGDSTTVFIAKSSNVYVVKDGQNYLFSSSNEKVKKFFSRQKIVANKKKNLKLSFSNKNKIAKCRTSQTVKKQKFQEYLIVCKAENNCVLYVVNSVTKQNLILPSLTLAFIGIILKHILIHYSIFGEQQNSFNLQKFCSSENYFSYPIRPPPDFI